VSPDLIEKINFELGQLRKLLSETNELINTSKHDIPSGTNRWALGAVLHAFYNGIENILKRIAVVYDEKSDKNSQWHIDLLTQMSKATTKRKAVISENMLNVLKKYLAFRHLFRSIYTHELKWEPMAELVIEVENAFTMFEDEILFFCKEKQLPDFLNNE
jgi:hypothetical protein